MNRYVKGIIVPFTAGFPKHFIFTEKLIGILLMPQILMMWYGYYMWKNIHKIGRDKNE